MEQLNQAPQIEVPPANIFLPTLLASLITLINDLQRKNTTMINYYIYPNPTPTIIAAYEPRLLVIRSRIQSFSELSLPHISAMIDGVIPLLASYIRPNVEQLASASFGIQKIFIEHYDRKLEKTLPYESIFATLRHYIDQIHHFIPINSQRMLPAERHLSPPSATIPSVCPGAIAFLNNRDGGKVSNVLPNELLSPHKGRLADKGGVVLWWECYVCAFRLRYHASNSLSLNINHTDEFMFEDGVTDIAFRSAWLVKSHIYHVRQPKPPAPSPPTSPTTRPDPFNNFNTNNTSASASRQKRPQPAPKRVSFTRRRSSISRDNSIITESTTTSRIIARSPSHSPPRDGDRNRRPSNARSNSNSNSSQKQEPTGPNNLKYFCLFCNATGKQMVGPTAATSDSDSNSDDSIDPTCFEDSKDLLEHIEERHTGDRPNSLLLQKLKVAVRGEMGTSPEARAGRWDLDFR